MAGKSQVLQSVLQLVLDQVALSSESQAAPSIAYKIHPEGNVDLYDVPSFFHKQKKSEIEFYISMARKGHKQAQ